MVKMNRDRINNKIYSYLDHLYALDYRERPVDIDTFLCDPQFFGPVTENGKIIYPIWRETLRDITRDDSKYIIVLTGGIRTGKSRTAIYAIGYTMHRILCLKDPFKFFRKGSGGQFTIAFFNLTKSLSESRGFNILQNCLYKSKWFRDRGTVGGTDLNPRVHFPIFEYKLGTPQSQGFGVLGGDILIASIDEVDNPIASEKQKSKILAEYNAAFRRFEGTFVFDGESIGRFFLLSSKQEKLSLLNTYITQMKNDPHVYIKDIPIWKAKPNSEYCGEKFKMSLGDVYMPPKIIESTEEEDKAIKAGYKILEIPIEYKEKFQLDPVGSLRDFAGVSITHLRSSKLFPSESILMACYDKSKQPVGRSTIEIGLKDEVDLLSYIDLSQIRVSRNVPRYIHIDIAFSGDALGFGMSCISGWSKVNKMQKDGTFRVEKAPVAETDFAIRLKARAGDQIPIHKVRKLILDLKEVCRFNVVLSTWDLRLASTDSMQILESSGIRCESFSMDKDPQVYRSFRDIVGEGRWKCPYDPYLHFELANLDDDRERNKIDHPDKVEELQLLDDGTTKDVVIEGSKDKADGVAGSVMKAIENCQEPPDIEILKKALEQVIAPTVEGVDQLWWVDSNKSSKINAKLTETPKVDTLYNDILKKALG